MLNIVQLSSSWRAFWPRSVLDRVPSFAAMRRAVETRRQLAELSDASLRDLSISRADALAEAARAPWDLATRRIGWRD